MSLFINDKSGGSFFINSQNTFVQASQKKPLLGVHGCSIGQAKADGCEVIVAIVMPLPCCHVALLPLQGDCCHYQDCDV